MTRDLPPSAKDILGRSGHVAVPAVDRPLERGELLDHLAGADAIVAMLYDRIDREALEAAGPQLAVVANLAVGFDNLDLTELTKRGVVVTNTPRVLDEATADIALGLLLMVTRGLGPADRFLRRGGDWRWDLDFMLGAGVQGKLLGIVGLGRIGQAFARRARALGMNVHYSGRRRASADVEGQLDATFRELDELFATADVVSLHVPLSRETHHLVNADRLRRMRQSAYLINTARGEIVDEDALVVALAEGRLAGAGLDVFQREPRVHPRLLTMDNVALLPHLGSATHEARTAMSELAARNVAAVLDGKPPLTAVNGHEIEREIADSRRP